MIDLAFRENYFESFPLWLPLPYSIAEVKVLVSIIVRHTTNGCNSYFSSASTAQLKSSSASSFQRGCSLSDDAISFGREGREKKQQYPYT